MKPIKTFGLAALAVLMATAFTGAPSAMAEETALCSTDPGKGEHEACPPDHLVSHIHAAGRVTVLTPVLNVDCFALSLEDTVGTLASPLVTHGAFTFSSCHSVCTVTEENGPTAIEFLKLGHEKADYKLEWLLHVICGKTLNCTYNGVALEGAVKGPLLTGEIGTEISLSEQTQNKEAGFLCPSTSKINFILFTLLKTHITN